VGELTDDHELGAWLREVHRVAIVGVSPRPDRPSHSVAAYVLSHTDWEVDFVNPTCEFVLGRPTYPSLAALPRPPDLVDVFRRTELLAEITNQAIEIGAGGVWFQLGLIDDRAAATASTAGMAVVQNRCLRIEHERLLRFA